VSKIGLGQKRKCSTNARPAQAKEKRKKSVTRHSFARRKKMKKMKWKAFSLSRLFVSQKTIFLFS